MSKFKEWLGFGRRPQESPVGEPAPEPAEPKYSTDKLAAAIEQFRIRVLREESMPGPNPERDALVAEIFNQARNLPEEEARRTIEGSQLDDREREILRRDLLDYGSRAEDSPDT